VYAHFIEYGQFSSFYVYLVKVKANRERETQSKIDWHIYVYIELRSFSLSLVSLCVNNIYFDVSFANSLFLCPFFSIPQWSEYTSLVDDNPSQYNTDDVANNRTWYTSQCIRVYSHAERIMSQNNIVRKKEEEKTDSFGKGQ
jgi:hypothetical protein